MVVYCHFNNQYFGYFGNSLYFHFQQKKNIKKGGKLKATQFYPNKKSNRGIGNIFFKIMENQEKQIKINLDPVLYALSNMNIGFNEEVFDFLMVSGNQARQFRASPKHAKRIYLLLGKYLDEYEKKFGPLETKLPERRETTQERKIGFDG